MSRGVASLLLAVLCFSAPAWARVDVCYYGGSNLPNFKINGDGLLDGTNLIITKSASTQRAAVTYATPLSTAGDIHIKMVVRISANVAGGADGMTFVMHNDPQGVNAIGNAGDGIGYAGITKSVIVEFDTYLNNYFGDPNDNHIGIQKNGDPNHAGVNFIAKLDNPPVTLKSGNPIYLWVDYTGTTKVLAVYVAASDSKPGAPTLSAVVDVPTIVGPQMYLTFTGSTGGSWSKHEVIQLLASDSAQPGAACCASTADCASSPLGAVCDTVKRTCGPCTLGNSASCPVGQQACDASTGINTCVPQCTGNLGGGGASPCTSSQYPACSSSGSTSGSCAACSGDYGYAGATYACPQGAPVCLSTGYCGVCTSNADCLGGTHAGGVCDGTTHACRTCVSDGECGAGNFCQAGQCLPKLANGTALPSGRTCPASANAVCTSGACNATTSTCAGPNGVACSAANQCTGNVCGSDGLCGCRLDNNCVPTSYCNYSVRTCVTDLANGQSIPTDGLHSGVCTAPVGAAVCASTVCNTSNNTCAQASGTSCSAGTQCASNTCTSLHCVPPSGGCWLDADCTSGSFCNRTTLVCTPKLANGTAIPNDGLHNGACSVANANAVCVSAACNATTNTCAAANGAACTTANQCVNNTCTSSTCVPSSGGCYVDTDCTSGNYCNRSTLTCAPKLANGVSIPSDGLHDGACTPSNATAVCASAACNATTNTCAGVNGAVCSTTNQCVNNTCTSGRCVPSSGGCYVDTDCTSANYCNRATLLCTPKLSNGTAIPNDGLHNGTCTPSNASAVCVSAACNATTNTCAAAEGGTCTVANECTTNKCASGHCVPLAGGCYQDVDCTGANYCDRATLTCAPKLAPGVPIPSDGLHDGDCTPANANAVCSSGVCNSASDTCASGDGETCGGNNQCVSNTCTSGHCVPATNGCYLDANCAAGSYCDRSALTCAPQLPPGTAIPSDGLHTGVCNATGSATCLSGACNTTTNTCGATEGGTCSGGAECATNTCVSGHCVPSGGSGCYLDTDCASTHFCDRTSLTCMPKLVPGTPIPNDGLHDGTCTPANATAVCSLGVCNVLSATCAAGDGVVCTLDAQCVSATCTSGHCVPSMGGCYVDTDCASTHFCDRSTLICNPKLPPGSPIPNDGLHTGTCTVGNASAVCTSGACNVATDTCGAGPSETCSNNNQCVSDACVSGHCVTGGGGGCYEDLDCAAGTYCDRGSLSCTPKLPPGAPLPNDGLHDGSCTTPQGTAVCVSGLCNSTTNTCANANGGTCAAVNECVSGTCTSGHCVPSGGTGCYVDGDCTAGTYCNRTTLSCEPLLGPGTPIPNDGPHDGTCASAGAVCASGLCNTSSNTCATGPSTSCTAGDQCVSDACVSGHCVPSGGNGCWLDGDCAAGTYCNRATLMCVTKVPPGSPIPNDGLHDGTCTTGSEGTGPAVCVSGLCNVTTHTCGNGPGETCAGASECATNTCTGGRCVPPTDGCWVDADCAGATYCDRATLTCKPKLAPGVPLPDDGLHPPECTSQNAGSVCLSGVCNPESKTCAAVVVTECSQNSQCQTNNCVSGHCVPATAGCYVDSDCGDGFCDRATLTCSPKLAVGDPVPNDGLHSGCTEENAQAVCGTGICNATTSTCALAEGVACTSDAQCGGNVCANGTCAERPVVRGGGLGCSGTGGSSPLTLAALLVAIAMATTLRRRR